MRLKRVRFTVLNFGSQCSVIDDCTGLSRWTCRLIPERTHLPGRIQDNYRSKLTCESGHHFQFEEDQTYSCIRLEKAIPSNHRTFLLFPRMLELFREQVLHVFVLDILSIERVSSLQTACPDCTIHASRKLGIVGSLVVPATCEMCAHQFDYHILDPALS